MVMFRSGAKLCVTALLALAACSPGADDTAPAGEAASAGAPIEQPAAPQASVVRPIVVMLGDSLTAGYDLSADNALPDQIEHKLAERSVTADLINAGVSGDTTRGALERYDWSVKGANADILLIALGANDFLGGLPVDVPKANLAALIERAKADGLMVGLIGIGLRGEGAADARDLAFAAVYPDLARQYDVPLFPDMRASVADRPEYLMPDGLHPNAKGVRLVAEDLTGFVAGLVTDWRAENQAPAAD